MSAPAVSADERDLARLKRLAASTPFPAADLDDHDDLGGIVTFVAALDDRRLYLGPRGVVLSARVLGEACVALELVEGEKARALRVAHHHTLDADVTEALVQAFRAGRDLDEAIAEVLPCATLTLWDEVAGGESLARAFLCVPRVGGARRGVLEVDEERGVVTRARVLSGSEALARIERGPTVREVAARAAAEAELARDGLVFTSERVLFRPAGNVHQWSCRTPDGRARTRWYRWPAG